MLSQVLIVHGENDALVPAANSRRLAAMLPGARLEVLPACGHNPQVIFSDQECCGAEVSKGGVSMTVMTPQCGKTRCT